MNGCVDDPGLFRIFHNLFIGAKTIVSGPEILGKRAHPARIKDLALIKQLCSFGKKLPLFIIPDFKGGESKLHVHSSLPEP